MFKVWSQMGHVSSTQELVGNADSQLPPQTCGHWQLHFNKMPTYPPLWDLCVLNPLLVSPGTWKCQLLSCV